MFRIRPGRQGWSAGRGILSGSGRLPRLPVGFYGLDPLRRLLPPKIVPAVRPTRREKFLALPDPEAP